MPCCSPPHTMTCRPSIPQIVQLLDVFESDTHMYLIQELCTGGTLEDLLRRAAGPLPEAQVAPLFRSIVKSILHCHQLGVLHRDVKPDNFLLSTSKPNQIVKLADFGLSCFYRRGLPVKEPVGSPYYMAPEMVTPGSGGYGPAADLFSCGVILYRFLTGNFPFPGNTTAEIFHRLKHKEPDYSASPAWRTLSPSARHLVRRLLEKDPFQRIETQDVLTHEWMTSTFGPAAGTQAASPGSGSPSLGLTARKLGAAACSPPTAGPTAVNPRNRVGDQVPSARIFFMPDDARPRITLQGFLDTFRNAEDAYQRLLRAPDADVAALRWEDVFLRLKILEDYLLEHACRDGPFFCGHGPSIAEAATAPALFRMVANLSAVRHLDLLAECQEGGLQRLSTWIAEVLARPAEVCDVAYLPPHFYVKMACKLHVTYVGPPSPLASSSPLGLPVASSSSLRLTPMRPTKFTTIDSAKELNYRGGGAGPSAGPAGSSRLQVGRAMCEASSLRLASPRPIKYTSSDSAKELNQWRGTQLAEPSTAAAPPPQPGLGRRDSALSDERL